MKNFRLSILSCFTFLILFANLYDATAQQTRPCAGRNPATKEAKVDVTKDGDVNIVPCPGKQVLVNGSPISSGGSVSDATTTTAGKVTLSKSGTNKAAADNDDRLGGVIGNYTKAGLPTSNVATGARARVTDSTKGIYRYDGSKWIPEDAGRRINLLDFCDPAANDNSSCLTTAMNALGAGGGTIVFPDGYTFKAASVDLSGRKNITLEGSAGKRLQTSTVNLELTTAGAGAGINMASSQGVTLRNLNIKATNAAFTGWVIKFGRIGEDTATTADDQIEVTDYLITGCTIQGVSGQSLTGLLDMAFSIIGKVEGNHFLYSTNWGIRGVENGTVAGTRFSYDAKIENNDFNFIRICIWNPHNSWHIFHNTFEPEDLNASAFNVVQAVVNENGYSVQGTTIEKNLIIDGAATASTKPVFKLNYLSGGSIKNNWINVSYNQTAIQLQSAQGVKVEGNRIEQYSGGTPAAIGVELSGANGGGNYGVSIENNNIETTTPYLLTASLGHSVSNNVKGGVTLGTETNNVMSVTGAVDLVPRMSSITTTGLQPKIGTTGFVEDLSNYSMLIQSGNNGDVPIAFATAGDNNHGSKIKALIAAGGLDLRVPLTTKYNNEYDIGTSSLRFKTGYFGTSIITPNVTATKLLFTGQNPNDGLTFDTATNTYTFSSDVGYIININSGGIFPTQTNQSIGRSANPFSSIFLSKTITAAGTTGAQTINKSSGTVNVAAGANSLVVTNSLVTANSLIFLTTRTNDSTCTQKNVVAGAGTFTINMSANCTAETSVGFLIFN